MQAAISTVWKTSKRFYTPDAKKPFEPGEGRDRTGVKRRRLRFGKESLALSIHNVDLFFKQKEDVENNTSELIVLDPA